MTPPEPLNLSLKEPAAARDSDCACCCGRVPPTSNRSQLQATLADGGGILGFPPGVPGGAQCVQPAGQHLHQVILRYSTSCADADHAVGHRKQIIDPMTHFPRQHLLLVQGALEALLAAHHP